MSSTNNQGSVQQVLSELDRLIAEMTSLRQQVALLDKPAIQPKQSIRLAPYYGMWAGRDDMDGLSSRAWLEQIRQQQ